MAKALEVGGFAIGGAGLPAAIDDSDPFEGERTQGLVMVVAFA